MTDSLNRLLNPKSLAVIGGGAWGESVIQQAQKFGFDGAIWPIHPSKTELAGLPAFRGVPNLPSPPDAAFIGINRDATIGAAERLSKAGAGGAVCFASGFAEAHAEDGLATDAQTRLLRAAGDMPILGPNCYGFINALDGAIVWPDQHGLTRVDRGVAILTQSSNIAINLTFQARNLPIAMMITCGNMAQTSQAAIIDALLDDDRITAVGVHIEGFTDLVGWQAVAQKAHAKDIPIVALKAGRSAAARAATQSHTASLAGEDTSAEALLSFLAIGRVNTLPELLEALKLGHVCGRLNNPAISSISCSGGEASLAADLGQAHGLVFPPLTDTQTTTLRDVLGPKVALANPLDYHTYIWRDAPTMTAAWSAMADPDVALTMTIVDIPDPARADPQDWECAITAAIGVKDTGGQVAMVSSLPETMPADTATRLMAHGVAPLQGLSEAMAATAALVRKVPGAGLLTGPVCTQFIDHGERAAKEMLRSHGLNVPKNGLETDPATIADLTFPVVAKADRIAHKTEQNAVILNLTTPADVQTALASLPSSGGFNFVEEMAQGCVVELLVAMTNDPAHGIMLTIGAGGTLAELWQDTQHLMLPATADQIDAAIGRLRIAPLIEGYRGQPGANRLAIIDQIIKLQSCVASQTDGFVEIEINPLICTQTETVIADALWRQTYPE
jgi:acyl-CoA synthetase (NDP forming)